MSTLRLCQLIVVSDVSDGISVVISVLLQFSNKSYNFPTFRIQVPVLGYLSSSVNINFAKATRTCLPKVFVISTGTLTEAPCSNTMLTVLRF